jgi:hypothetical protein
MANNQRIKVEEEAPNEYCVYQTTVAHYITIANFDEFET